MGLSQSLTKQNPRLFSLKTRFFSWKFGYIAKFPGYCLKKQYSDFFFSKQFLNVTSVFLLSIFNLCLFLFFLSQRFKSRILDPSPSTSKGGSSSNMGSRLGPEKTCTYLFLLFTFKNCFLKNMSRIDFMLIFSKQFLNVTFVFLLSFL